MKQNDEKVISLLKEASLILENRMEKLEKEYQMIIGKFLGFPDCCVKSFVEGNTDKITPNDFTGTGFIPCNKCLERNTKELIAYINKNRKCPSVFPKTNGRFYETMKDSDLWSEEDKRVVREFQSTNNQILKIHGVIFSIKGVSHGRIEDM